MIVPRRYLHCHDVRVAYRHVVIAVVRGDATEHVGDVVEPSQHEVVTEIELLHLRVRRHVVLVRHLEDAPGLGTFDMRLAMAIMREMFRRTSAGHSSMTRESPRPE